MIKYWLNNIRNIKVIPFLAISVFGLSTSCTDVNDTTGNGSFLPGSYEIFIDTVYTGFIIETVECDSLVSDNLRNTYLGSTVSPKYGQINFSLISQMMPFEVFNEDSEDHPFGENNKVDSVIIFFDTYLAGGNPEEIFKFSVYELKEPLPYGMDSSYYSNFLSKEGNRAKYISDEPLFSIDKGLYENLSSKMPVEFGERLLSLKASEYKNLDEFRSAFPGLYFETSKVSSGEMLLSLNVDESYRNLKVIVPTILVFYRQDENVEKSDTSFMVSLARSSIQPPPLGYTSDISIPLNKSITLIDRDYSLKDPNLGIEWGDGYSGNTTYFTGMQGVMTKLEIKEQVIDEIKELVKTNGGSKIIVANATMILPVGETDINSLNRAIRYIGFYNNYQAIKDQNYINIKDVYNPNLYDITNFIQDYSNFYNTTGSFGGFINRSTNEYRVNITNLIQGLVNNVTDDRSIEIAPGGLFNPALNSVALDRLMDFGVGTIDKKGIKLLLTYSVL